MSGERGRPPLTPMQQRVLDAAQAEWERQGKSLDPHDDRVIAAARMVANDLREKARRDAEAQR